ncbi:hypothetical protein NGB36_16840 [Streptomyces sp. RB6PN25]|uniref:Uncharacterized protein n=1 Tax=Streptomyces humicola TaxID=2953240 RepID=A0ABT1PX36_9ACTN|nr:hypothetical protein [Streptomyces humicola]MCQ4082227.1 hypothetical protein [Streptomyces humicola]
MNVAEHWHAFEYVGHERPADSLRVDPTNPTPPLEIGHWLRKPARHVAETFTNDDAGRKEASEWMRQGGEEHAPADGDSFPLDARMTYVNDDLQRGADVIWGYYTKKQRYHSRALVACPREGISCPYGR